MTSFPAHFARNVPTSNESDEVRPVVGSIESRQNVDADGNGYTSDFQGTPAIGYSVYVNFGGIINTVPLGWSALQRYAPPLKVRALDVGSIVVGVAIGEQMYWLYQELPAVGCEP